MECQDPVRTLLDKTKADRPERRTALVARELGRYNVDIAALSETRLPDKGQLTETGGGYTFFWSGRRTAAKSDARQGVGFAIKNTPRYGSSPTSMRVSATV